MPNDPISEVASWIAARPAGKSPPTGAAAIDPIVDMKADHDRTQAEVRRCEMTEVEVRLQESSEWVAELWCRGQKKRDPAVRLGRKWKRIEEALLDADSAFDNDEIKRLTRLMFENETARAGLVPSTIEGVYWQAQLLKEMDEFDYSQEPDMQALFDRTIDALIIGLERIRAVGSEPTVIADPGDTQILAVGEPTIANALPIPVVADAENDPAVALGRAWQAVEDAIPEADEAGDNLHCDQLCGRSADIETEMSRLVPTSLEGCYWMARMVERISLEDIAHVRENMRLHNALLNNLVIGLQQVRENHKGEPGEIGFGEPDEGGDDKSGGGY